MLGGDYFHPLDGVSSPEFWLVEDKLLLSDCKGWVECTLRFASWLLLGVLHLAAFLVAMFLCCWPDVMVFWRPGPCVQGLSYFGYLRQQRQRLVAEAARQAAAAGPRNRSPAGSRRRLVARHAVPRNTQAPASATDGSDAVSTGSGGKGQYAVFLFRQCWWPRAKFAVVAYIQALWYLLTLPVRMVLAVLMFPLRVFVQHR